MRKFIFIIIFSMFVVGLSACQNDNGTSKSLVIKNSSVEFGSLQDPDDRKLHFWVEISDNSMEPELEYKVRFIVQNPYIRDLIAAEIIEAPGTYKTFPKSGLVTSGSTEIKQDFNIDKIRKNLKKNEAVIVEIYDEDRTIARGKVTNFRENIMPKAKISPNAKIKMIDIKETDKKEIFRRAVSDSEKDTNLYYMVNPDYSFSLDEESYFLWLSEDKGSIMNAKDPYMTYSITNSSLKEITDFINID
ncbi:hypothetical protein [Solibacillus sp. CAU 1738]|uniref:hypothetical protein n=1 Tax=Solibacillus sp. CAU 1738 TaxID=3140363 RepID=UPI0032613859